MRGPVSVATSDPMPFSRDRLQGKLDSGTPEAAAASGYAWKVAAVRHRSAL